MTLSAALLAGLMLGLSSAGSCFWSCTAVLGPFLVATEASPPAARWSTVGSALRALGCYHLGRLLAYILAGASFALLGSAAALPPLVHAGLLLAAAAVLVIAVLRPASHASCSWPHRARRAGTFALGLLQGLSPCPPFLVAAGLVLAAPRMGSSLLLFFALFASTALLTLPLAFLEPLRRRRSLVLLMRVMGGLVAFYLSIRAVLLVRG